MPVSTSMAYARPRARIKRELEPADGFGQVLAQKARLMRRQRRWLRCGTAAIISPVLIVSMLLAFSHSSAEDRSLSESPEAHHPVAIIVLGDDAHVRARATQLLDALSRHPFLSSLTEEDTAALLDDPPYDDAQLNRANRNFVSAEANLATSNFHGVIEDVNKGKERLLTISPLKAFKSYADLSVVLGQSLLSEKDEAGAREAFALAARLEPDRALDWLRYPRRVVKLFEAAKAKTPSVGTIRVHSLGWVWIDSEEVGSAPGSFKTSYGNHVVWIDRLEYATAGEEVQVTATKPTEVFVQGKPLPRPMRLAQLRQSVEQSRDEASRVRAMERLASFLNVRDAVLLQATENWSINWQFWHDGAKKLFNTSLYDWQTSKEILDQWSQRIHPTVTI